MGRDLNMNWYKHFIAEPDMSYYDQMNYEERCAIWGDDYFAKENRMNGIWMMLHPRMTMDALGYIPGWFRGMNPIMSGARDIIRDNYISGWEHFKGFKKDEQHVLTYPEDPPLRPLAKMQWGDELVLYYQSSWVCVVQKDGSWEVSRID